MRPFLTILFELHLGQCIVTVFKDTSLLDHYYALLPKSVGANVLNLSPYSPDFNPIELWWSQLKSFLRQFSPNTTFKVDTLIATALDLVNPNHLRN